MGKIKIKYLTTRHPHKVVFGVWEDWKSWVEFQKKEINEKGHAVEFLMSYNEKDTAKSNPEIKVVNLHPFGTASTTEDWEETD